MWRAQLRHFGATPAPVAFICCKFSENVLAKQMLQQPHMNGDLRESEVLFDAPAAHSERAAGTIVAFVPAHGDSRAGAVAKHMSRTLTEGLGLSVLLADFDTRVYSLWNPNVAPRRLDGRTWGAFVSEVDKIDTLDARETHPRQLGRLLEHAREKYQAVCADLTGARAAHAIEVLRAADAIFLVSGSDHASLEGVCEKTDWLRAIDLSERVGLLLRRSSDGVDVDEVEKMTGLPVCSLIETDEQIEQLARWVAANTCAYEEEDSLHALAG